MTTPEHKRGLRPSRARLAIALLLAMAGVAGLWMLLAPSFPGAGKQIAAAPPPAPSPAPPPLASTATPPPTSPPPAAAPLPEGDADPTRDLSSYVARGEKPTMAQVIAGLHERGIYSGLGAFNPPGTSPPLVGLAVPANFALPEGFVRHHQTTDDGQPIEPILMFAPDYQIVDANNRPVPMPDNRVVPPELAPPGLPIRRIVVPPPADQSHAGR